MGVEIIRIKANSVWLDLPTGTELGNIAFHKMLKKIMSGPKYVVLRLILSFDNAHNFYNLSFRGT